MALEIIQQHKVHGGTLSYVRHASQATGTPMRFSVFIPGEAKGPHPYAIWLSGLTCTEDNFTTKAGAYGHAAQAGLAIVAPDTSPRGEGVADDPAYDLGQGAGFYVDATQPPWAPHFSMETYVTADLLSAVEDGFPLDPARRGIFGHSMGGHGALTLALRHPELFRTVSAFAPIASPTRCPWGRKAFAAYLGPNETAWAEHDAVLLIAQGRARGRSILVDQGGADNFLAEQLKPDLLEAAAKEGGADLTLRMQDGYDHSYFFISSFIGDHVAWHAARL
ncbi:MULTISPECIES: S-formylglutathione hydrolase [Phenylobacterium]|uniref:S-formylglutathione hydrolase n=1 Tax=Phenylobacterium koreense TaxID=266125 RepID=A0ABV2EG65_9CAUL